MKHKRKTRQTNEKTIADRIKNQLTLAFALSIFATWASMFYWEGGYRFPGQYGPVLRWHGWPVRYMGCSVEGTTHCMMNRWALVQNFAVWMMIFTAVFLVGFGIVWGAKSIINRSRQPHSSADLEPVMEGAA